MRAARPGPGRPRVAVVGDTLLDVDWTGAVERVCPDAPAPVVELRDERARPGGAGLAACCAAAAGARVTLVTALGRDPAGRCARALLDAAGVAVVDLGLAGPSPMKLRVRSSGQSLVRVDQGGDPAPEVGAWTAAAGAALAAADAVLVSDYGRGMAARVAGTGLLADLDAPVVWDPHLRGALPPPGLDLLVPNRDEGRRLVGSPAPGSDGAPAGDGAHAGDADGADRRLAGDLARRFGCPVALTVGGRGAVVARPGVRPVAVPVEAVGGDPCGAGDCFAATAGVARARGAPVVEAAATAAAAAADHVAAGFRGAPLPGGWGAGPTSRPVAAAPPTPPARGRLAVPVGPVAEDDDRADAVDLARAVRAAGGTVVVAGGCFDVLHAGHVRLLEAARRLGDCLIVCVNGDLSVRRLKGRHRPVNPVGDRAAVLRALASVDAVLVFDEDTAAAALTRLRPHLFVKGADHAGRDLPEQQVLARWGGEVVFVPVVPGRSTTRVLEIAAGTAAS